MTKRHRSYPVLPSSSSADRETILEPDADDIDFSTLHSTPTTPQLSTHVPHGTLPVSGKQKKRHINCLHAQTVITLPFSVQKFII
jgi:hypothetical protein